MATRRERLGRMWTSDEIEEDCVQAKSEFRHRRMLDPLVDYLNEFEIARTAAGSVIDQLPAILARPVKQEMLAAIVGNPASFMALRYLTAPPISEDDLDTLLGVSLSATALRKDKDIATALVDLLKETIDPKRFPWIPAHKTPTTEQLHGATLATAVAAAIQRVQTKRRGDEKKSLEGQVESLLLSMGYEKAPKPRGAIEHTEDLPGPGKFMTEVTIGSDNGDFVIGLPNRRRLALECKSSNSAINSRKRLNKEIVKNAKNWDAQFGSQVLTGAVLQGVFKPEYVEDAQDTPVLIFWGHRLNDLEQFIHSAK